MSNTFDPLRTVLRPSPETKERIHADIQKQIAEGAHIQHAVEHLSPSDGMRDRVWMTIFSRISHERVFSVFDRLRETLIPHVEHLAVMRRSFLVQSFPVPESAIWGTRTLKWASAFLIVVLVMNMRPFLFFASPTIAQSRILLLPTRGEVSLSRGAEWEAVTSETTLDSVVRLRTYDGEATIVLHDDGVIRLAPFTTVELLDIGDRPGPAFSDQTVILHSGRIWILGLVSPSLRGIKVKTAHGNVTIHEGSVSVVQGDLVDVFVWDRRSTVTHDGNAIHLVAGERTELWHANVPTVKRISGSRYTTQWVSQNLDRDAAHRLEIAKLQQDRRVAVAGILPTSPLYSMKRAVEAVDVLLTFGEERKAEKQLAQAENRLNEAAALLANGDEDAAEQLAEYRDAVIKVVSGSGAGNSVSYIVQRELLENAATLSAVLPEDVSYPLKRTILEASAALSLSVVDAGEIEGVLFVDALSLMADAVTGGDITQAIDLYRDLHAVLPPFNEVLSVLPPDIQREARTILRTIAVSLHYRSNEYGDVSQDLLKSLTVFLPPPNDPIVASLTEEELGHIVQSALYRIFETYSLAQSRKNQLLVELKAVRGHPDQGRILRRLYQDLPPVYAGSVRDEMRDLRTSLAL